MEKNYTKEIRKVVSKLYKWLMIKYNDIYGNINENILYTSVLESLNISEQYGMLYMFRDAGCLMTLGVVTLVRSQIYIDYYKKLNLKQKLGRISPSEQEEFKLLKENSEPSLRINLSRNACNSLSYNMLNACLTQEKTSVFDKILEVKALSKEDIRTLGNNMLFFDEDFQRYNFDISIDFIINKVKKLNLGRYKEDNEKCYDEVTDFIFNVYKVNKEEGEKIFDELFFEDSEVFLEKDNSKDFIDTSYGRVYKNNIKNIIRKKVKEESTKEKKKTLNDKK